MRFNNIFSVSVLHYEPTGRLKVSLLAACMTSFKLSSMVRNSLEANEAVILPQTGGERTHGILGVTSPQQYYPNPCSIK
jgi:hypothetical protein